MVQGKKIMVASLFAAASILTIQSAARAAVYTEVGDTGSTLATAQNAGAATGFSGTIGATSTSGVQDADLYVFTIANAGSYTFSSVGGTIDTTAGGALDTAIFLFDNNGKAILTNDDANGTNIESRMTVSLTAGTYYFGISLSGNEPVNSSGQLLFAGYPTNSGSPGGDPTANRGPAAGVNPTTEAGFDNASYSNDQGTYNVTITNAVPEPSTYAALACGSVLAGFAFLRRRSA